MHVMPRAREALDRAVAAHGRLVDEGLQRAEVTRLVGVGLQPITSTLECPVNGAALGEYAAHAGPEADVMQCDKRGRPLGTLREIASRFLMRLGGRDTVTLSYRHSLLGAELVAAGFVVASREYAVGAQADPFRLPRVLRAIAF